MKSGSNSPPVQPQSLRTLSIRCSIVAYLNPLYSAHLPADWAVCKHSPLSSILKNKGATWEKEKVPWPCEHLKISWVSWESSVDSSEHLSGPGFLWWDHRIVSLENIIWGDSFSRRFSIKNPPCLNFFPFLLFVCLFVFYHVKMFNLNLWVLF